MSACDCGKYKNPVCGCEFRADRDRLMAENKRLREALEDAVKWFHQCVVDDCCCEGAEGIAQSALKGEGEK